MRATLAGALRRQLLARGLTKWPVCPSCNVQRDPKDFVKSGICWGCEQDAKALDAVRAAYYGHGALPVADMVAPDAPFLPADDHV